MSQPRIDLGTDQDNVRFALWSEIEVRQALNQHWVCRIVMRNPPDAEPLVESQLGKPLKISTFSLLGTENVVFSGVVTRARRTIEVTGAFGIELTAHSHTYKLEQGPGRAYFRQSSAQAAVSAVLGQAGLSLAGEMPAGLTLSYEQHEETALSFVARLVDDAEGWFRPSVAPDAQGVEVHTAFQSGPTVQWREGEYGLLEWQTHGRVHPLSVGGTAYDPQPMLSETFGPASSQPGYSGGAARMLSGAQSAGGALKGKTMTDRDRVATNGQYQQRLQRESRRAAASLVVCRGVSREPQVRAGDTVTVAGLPEVDSTYGVIACTHTWTPQGYENKFEAVPAVQWSPVERPLAPTATGVATARVIEDYDPHDEGRLQLAYYWQEQDRTTWARIVTPHAGPDRGMHFVPEKGDEVLVAFEEGDPERPYVVGSVWNGVNHTPAEGFWRAGELNKTEVQPNDIKRLVTKSGHRITLVDTPGRETITLATPTGTRLMLAERLNETDGRPGILLHSNADIILSADGRIHQHSKYGTRQVGAAAND